MISRKTFILIELFCSPGNGDNDNDDDKANATQLPPMRNERVCLRVRQLPPSRASLPRRRNEIRSKCLVAFNCASMGGGMTQRKVFVCFILGYASILCALELCERARDKRKPCAYLLTHLAELSRLRKATNDDGHIDGTHNMRDTRRNRKGNSLSFIWRAKYIVGGHEAQFERNIGSYFMTMARTMVGILTVTNQILRSTALRCVCQSFGSEQRTSSDVPTRKNKLWRLNRFAVCVHKVYAHVLTLSRTTTLINAHTREFSPSSSA